MFTDIIFVSACSSPIEARPSENDVVELGPCISHALRACLIERNGVENLLFTLTNPSSSSAISEFALDWIFLETRNHCMIPTFC